MTKMANKVAKTFIAMARGTLVVDECIKEIAAALRSSNIHIIEPQPGEKDKDIIERLLPNRIIVTKNSVDFKNFASSYDFGIIDISKLKYIDSSISPSQNKTVRLISDAIIKFNLWSIRHGFILTLHDNGKHVFKELTV